ncbi:MAG TPA: TIGR04282 family arsenosugar biosynthesis glycosyltransferase [Oligoflexus sp.]|uniref:TIGR04282 family arsenosugar biosynthesis glycosyltransferase n=1 Tax=Oligoflexus sp. TaxID=1971216 RepID=UPI002D450C26|nr:TIGR04282 family arsenosugar biosynthesis glycosyltransferase [Oligoflexus sp.]HYX36226.1 TIGR04282 family arsenosugar biosynthesis glycosyltransferase [Oligoflexus sp.]
MSKTRIIIFAKAPVPGFAKTRLIPALGAEGAAELARRMLLLAMEQALQSGATDVELCATPSIQDPSWDGLHLTYPIKFTEQGTGDLGERLARAASRACAAGAHVLLIGTDCPDLNARTLQQAIAALDRNESVMIPTFDGGYALLGFKSFDPSLFENIHWSTSSVACETQARIKALAWTLELLPMLHDIDEPDDLQWLRL